MGAQNHMTETWGVAALKDHFFFMQHPPEFCARRNVRWSHQRLVRFTSIIAYIQRSFGHFR